MLVNLVAIALSTVSSFRPTSLKRHTYVYSPSHEVASFRLFGQPNVKQNNDLVPNNSNANVRSALLKSVISGMGLFAGSHLLHPSNAAALDDFMSPESEGSGGRFGNKKLPKSQRKSPRAPQTPASGFQTKSGLRYFDFQVGSGNSPRYGELITFHYSLFYQPRDLDESLELIDSTYDNKPIQPFLQKHGNGRIVRGLDEGMHTMKVGGKRRIIVPKSIGYTDFDLGPLPQKYRHRQRLGDLIDYANRDEGEFVFDIDLLQIREDENDQGYYEDIPVSQNEVRELIIKSLKSKDPDIVKRLGISEFPPLPTQ